MKIFSELPLVGLKLIQICLGPYQVILNFEEDVAVSIMNQFSLINKNDARLIVDYMATAGYANIDLLTLLLERRILDAKISNNSDLILRFDNEMCICVSKLESNHSVEVRVKHEYFDF